MKQQTMPSGTPFSGTQTPRAIHEALLSLSAGNQLSDSSFFAIDNWLSATVMAALSADVTAMTPSVLCPYARLLTLAAQWMEGRQTAVPAPGLLERRMETTLRRLTDTLRTAAGAEGRYRLAEAALDLRAALRPVNDAAMQAIVDSLLSAGESGGLAQHLHAAFLFRRHLLYGHPADLKESTATAARLARNTDGGNGQDSADVLYELAPLCETDTAGILPRPEGMALSALAGTAANSPLADTADSLRRTCLVFACLERHSVCRYQDVFLEVMA